MIKNNFAKEDLKLFGFKDIANLSLIFEETSPITHVLSRL